MPARALSILVLLAASAPCGEAPNLSHLVPPAGRVGVREAIEGAVRFLVEHQNPNGSFGTRTSGRTWGIRSHVPGGHQAFQAATTALCWLGLHGAEPQPEASRAAQARALAWLARHARVKRATGDELYNTWALAYGLRALAVALRDGAPGAEPAVLRSTATEMLAAIDVYQTPDGGWGYYDFGTRTLKPSWSTSFSTATMLVALHAAREAGLEVPERVVEKALHNVASCRKPDGSYLYGYYARYWPQGGVHRPQGSSLRTQACNLALRLWGRMPDDGDLREGLEQLRAHHRFAIAGVRRPIPHESWYAVSGYFYLYGQQYAALVLDRLSGPDRRIHAPAVIEAVLKTRQPDGSFWDYPLYGYHKFYGTGYALIALARCSAQLSGAR